MPKNTALARNLEEDALRRARLNGHERECPAQHLGTTKERGELRDSERAVGYTEVIQKRAWGRSNGDFPEEDFGPVSLRVRSGP